MPIGVVVDAARVLMRPGVRAGHVVAICATLLAAGCEKKNAYQPPPPPQVGIAHPVTRTVTPYLEATGTTAAFNQIDLQARVQGFVSKIGYTDGAAVKAGETLFVIEPAPYQAKYQQAQAALAGAQAQFAQADAEYKRQYQLGQANVNAKSQIDSARATRDSAQATVQSDEAGLVQAGINLGYTNVVAPFNGVATAHLVSVGALVGVTGPTTLATLLQLEPIYVNFNVPEGEVQRIRSRMAKAAVTLRDLGTIKVEVGLPTENGFPHSGTLDYVSPEVDTGTGTLAARAVFGNADHTLLPGYFVRVRVPRSNEAAPSLLVPDAAIGTDQAGTYVLVVGKNDVLEQRPVRVGQRDGALRVIESGLSASDMFVVDGIARGIPGQKVSPYPATPG